MKLTTKNIIPIFLFSIIFTGCGSTQKDIASFHSFETECLGIELDGSQHGEEENAIKDEKRTEYLEQFGIMVLRIPNYEMNKNFKGVCTYIDKVVQERLLG